MRRCRRPTPVSTWLYANFSDCYDPLPRIFYDSRGGRRDLYGEDGFSLERLGRQRRLGQ